MLSRFFIDRPVFATVLSVAITLIGGAALWSLPVAQYPRITPPGVAVAISYPGASAQVVADTVAAPIEQQVTGVPGMLYMSSQSGNDGSYSLNCTFDVGTNLDAALVMVQNRVTLAIPLLPTPVQRQGITIRKRTPDILLLVNFTSTEGRYDDVYLSNFVLINVRDELLRVDGVSDINILGERDYSMRVWLDPQKLAARNMTAGDVATAIRTQNIEGALGQVGQAPMRRDQAFQHPIDTLGRLRDPEQFGDIIVKTFGGSFASVSGGRGTQGGSASRSGIPDPLQRAASTSAMTFGPSMNGQTSAVDTATSGATAPGTPSSGTPSSGSSVPAITPPISPPMGNTVIVQHPTNAPATIRTDTAALSGGATALGGAQAAGGGTTAGGASGGTTSGTVGTTTSGAQPGTTATGTLSGSATLGGSQAPGLAALPPSGLTTGGASVSGPDNGALSSTDTGFGPQPSATAIVRLRDVARVEMGALNYNQAVTFDGRPSVGLAIYQLPDANALDVADRVRARLQELSARFPEGVTFTIGYDTTPFIRESIAEVFKTLRDAILLVALVVLFFLQDWRAMILPMIDVPVSLIGTFAVMALLGYSLNNISLFGLVLAIGIVVDDAIVVLENIERQMALGLDPRSATIKAMEEITGPIIAITIVLSAVFIPCALISGITGRFFRQFAVTIAASTIISAVNALTMTPSRALMILKSGGFGGGHGGRAEALPWWIFGVAGGWLAYDLAPPVFRGLPDWLGWTRVLPGVLVGLVIGWAVIRPVNAVLGWIFGGFNRLFDWVTAAYGWTVGKAMRGAAAVLLLYAGLLVLTWWLFEGAPTGFVPQQDMGRCLAGVQLPDSSSLSRTKAVMARVEAIARETPGVAHTITICGMSFVQQANGPNFGSLFIVLKPFDQRRNPALKDEAIMARLRERWAREVKDAQVVVFGAPPIPGLSVAGGFKLMVEDRGGLGVEALETQTDRLIARLRAHPGLVGVSTQFRSGIPQLYLDIDWNKVASLGLSPGDVDEALQIFLGSSYVNPFNEFGRHWQVTLQAEGAFRSRPSDLSLIQVRNKWGMMVPLGTLGQIRAITGPVFINRYNLYTAAPVTGSLRPGASSGDVIASVDRIALEVLPRSMNAEWTELMFLQIREAGAAPPQVVFALSVLFVFLALAALYESWTLPLAVILVVPLCVLCSVTGVLAARSTVNIFVQVGLVVLVGLACKNAILIVEFAREKHEGGLPVLEATREASRLRLRPIVMTSFAFILGVVPLVVAAGAGAEMRRSLGTAVFAGMLGVTFFGLFLTPVFYYVVQGFGEARLLATSQTRLVLSAAVGGVVGLAGGYLVGRLGVVRPLWAEFIGGCVGVLGVLAERGLKRRLRR